MNNKKLEVAFEKIDNNLVGGYVSENAVVKFYSDYSLQPLQGQITSVSFDSIKHMATITFSGKCNFLLGLPDITWEWTGASSGNWNDALNWNMTGHPEIHSIPIAANDVTIPSGSIRMPVVSTINNAICRNLTIESSANLMIMPGNNLTVNGNLTLLNE